jgi:hypothetical protein
MQLVALGAAGDDPFKHVGQPGFRVETIEFGRIKKCRKYRPGFAAAGVTTKQTIASSYGN